MSELELTVLVHCSYRQEKEGLSAILLPLVCGRKVLAKKKHFIVAV